MEIRSVTLPEISVPGSFASGGNTSGINTDTQNRYELQNITYITKGKHALKIGGRLRDTVDNNASNASFNGSYSFGTRVDPTVARVRRAQSSHYLPHDYGHQCVSNYADGNRGRPYHPRYSAIGRRSQLLFLELQHRGNSGRPGQLF